MPQCNLQLLLPVLLLLATLLCLLQQPVLHILQPLLQQGLCCGPLTAAAGDIGAFLLLAAQLLLQIRHLLLCVLQLLLQLGVLRLPGIWQGTHSAMGLGGSAHNTLHQPSPEPVNRSPSHCTFSQPL
jgi:hypothetical protein